MISWYFILLVAYWLNQVSTRIIYITRDTKTLTDLVCYLHVRLEPTTVELCSLPTLSLHHEFWTRTVRNTLPYHAVALITTVKSFYCTGYWLAVYILVEYLVTERQHWKFWLILKCINGMFKYNLFQTFFYLVVSGRVEEDALVYLQSFYLQSISL